jgi:tRNA(fMet)-specific endonuclease VapC
LRYLLDTNVCIEIINGRPAKVRERFQTTVRADADLFVSSVTSFELWYGAEKSDRKEFNRRRVEAFFAGPLQVLQLEEDDARRAGEVRAALEAQGKPIGPYDTLIAGQALHRKLSLVTANVREFSRVKGLTLENWTR